MLGESGPSSLSQVFKKADVHSPTATDVQHLMWPKVLKQVSKVTKVTEASVIKGKAEGVGIALEKPQGRSYQCTQISKVRV